MAIKKEIDVVSTPGPYYVGDQVAFNVTVYNQGTLDATEVLIEDYIPTGMNFISSPDFSLSGSQYFATIALLEAGTSLELDLILEIDQAFMLDYAVNNVEIVSAENALDYIDEDSPLLIIDGVKDDETELDTDNDIDDEAPGTPGTDDNT